MSDELLTLLVPCFNEEHNIEHTVRGIFAEALPVTLDVLLVDDCSTDGTLGVMERLAERYPVRIRRNPENLGLGRTVMSAYASIDPDSWVCVIPGDNEFDFRSIHRFLDARHDLDVVLGYIQNPVIRPFERRIGSWAFTKTVATLYGFPYQYFNGMKMYRCRAFSQLEVISSGHAYIPELLAKAVLRNPALRIGQVPYITRGRATGETKAFQPKSIWKAMREVARGKASVDAYREVAILALAEEAARTAP
jgi:glycosyltransferase involved in cell wall biosynthesis